MDTAERKRLSRNTVIVLQRLQQGPATNEELLPIGGFRYGARVQDLREAGYIVESSHIKGGIWSFALKAEPNAA